MNLDLHPAAVCVIDHHAVNHGAEGGDQGGVRLPPYMVGKGAQERGDCRVKIGGHPSGLSARLVMSGDCGRW